VKLVGVLAVFIGLYIAIEWGILGKSVVASAAQLGASATTGGAVSGQAPPPPSLFGVTGTFSGFGELYNSTVAGADQAGLTANGGGKLAHDFNYGALGGQPVTLPAGTFTYLGNTTGAWGNLLAFRTANGGVIELPHLENLPALVVGQNYGGAQIGTVGRGPYSSTFWSNPHLAVIADNAGLGYLNSLLIGRAN
jgi:hypothetical protein